MSGRFSEDVLELARISIRRNISLETYGESPVFEELRKKGEVYRTFSHFSYETVFSCGTPVYRYLFRVP